MEQSTNRRQFLLNSSLGLAGLALTPWDLAFKKVKPKLAFSTLGCPKWDWDTILKYASTSGYEGVEIRCIQDKLDLPNLPIFNSPEAIALSLRKAKDLGIKIVDLGSSTALHTMDPVKRKTQMDDARKFIDLAAKLECPFIRVYPNEFPKGQDRNKTIDLIIGGLKELGEYCQGSKVTVLMETHGQVVSMDLLHQIMSQADHPHVGLIWDVFNMWSITKESPTAVYQKLRPYIKHTHIKDAIVKADGTHEFVLLGKGNTTIAEAVALLVDQNFKGYYSFEWEKLWHPEIGDPEIAIPDYPIAFHKLYAKK
jgi:sugar phosphate isomerase/epimerase